MNNAYSAQDVLAGLAPYKVGDVLGKQHVSEQTAYIISDYPYGSLRCLMRVWIEYKAKSGMRLVQQTQNPKNGRWNTPRKSTYSNALVMVFNEEGHLVPSSWQLSSPDKAEWFLGLYEDHLPLEAVRELKYARAYHAAMEQFKAAADPPLLYNTPQYWDAYRKASAEALKAIQQDNVKE